MPIETCETEEISWIDNASKGNATDDCATPKGEREREEGFPGPKPAGMGNTHPPTCDYVISLALGGSENPAASPSSPLLFTPPFFFFVLVLRLKYHHNSSSSLEKQASLSRSPTLHTIKDHTTHVHPSQIRRR
jgi:hypothetical protein